VTTSDLDVVIGEQFLPSFVLPPISTNIKKYLKTKQKKIATYYVENTFKKLLYYNNILQYIKLS
jgi:hypothetical protein